ncbi:hypothetical protein [Vibrio sp. VB16]|uniref:hypothetical protein n=1 Tax=Vibrio sp. VB16 TaxID=2785746 RepID=UPI00189C93B5|nr:hypothetical protein [Vibrio sp. VB16]UGA55419.1 hypothetical protein IUZ65_003430 [Vibrio sp. VB16]
MKKFPESGFDYHARLLLADGSTDLLGRVISNRKKLAVKTYNFQTQKIESQLIEGWYRMPVEENWLHVLFRGGRNGRSGFKCLSSQKLFDGINEKTVIELDLGDTVSRIEKTYYTDLQHQIILGGILGDSSLRFEKSPRGHVRFAHGYKQAEYMKYKAELLNLDVKLRPNGVTYADSERCEEFSRYSDISKHKAILDLPLKYIELLTPICIAIWYMDDGHHVRAKKYGAGGCSIAAKKLTKKNLTLIADKIDELGLGRANVREGVGLFFYGKESILFQEGISLYVPDCMEYKISPWYRKTEDDFSCEIIAPIETLYPCELIHRWATVPPRDNRYKYSLKTRNNNCFLSGVLVHLSG